MSFVFCCSTTLTIRILCPLIPEQSHLSLCSGAFLLRLPRAAPLLAGFSIPVHHLSFFPRPPLPLFSLVLNSGTLGLHSTNQVISTSLGLTSVNSKFFQPSGLMTVSPGLLSLRSANPRVLSSHLGFGQISWVIWASAVFSGSSEPTESGPSGLLDNLSRSSGPTAFKPSGSL